MASDGDSGVIEPQHLQQHRNGGDLIALVIDFQLAEHGLVLMDVAGPAIWHLVAGDFADGAVSDPPDDGIRFAFDSSSHFSEGMSEMRRSRHPISTYARESFLIGMKRN